MDATNTSTNGSFTTYVDQPKKLKQRYKLGGNNSRFEFSPVDSVAEYKDENGLDKKMNTTDVKDMFSNPYMVLKPIKGRSLGVYIDIPAGLVDDEGVEIDPSVHFQGYASFNDNKTQLTMDDHAEDILECVGESISRVKSPAEVKAFIKATSNKQ